MLAEEVAKVIAREESLFENAKTDTVLLIIDRSEDPVTPLLNQWTYEAMVLHLIFTSSETYIKGFCRISFCA